MNKSKLAGWIFIIFLIWMPTACSGGATESAPRPLRVGWTARNGNFTLLIAKEMGFFERYGLNVEPVHYDNFSPARADLAGAIIDGGLFPIGDALLITSQASLKTVMVSDSGGSSSVVVSPEIASIRDLEGKRIGVNLHTSSEMFITYMLESVGLSPRDVTLVEMDPGEVPQSIPGIVDAGYVLEPYTTQALQQGFQLLYSNPEYSSMIPNVIVFRQEIVEQRPNDIRSFIQAWNDAVSYRINNPQEALNIIIQATGLSEDEIGIPGDGNLYTIEDNKNLFAVNPGRDSSSIYYIAQFNLNFLIEVGEITKSPDLNTLLDPSFLTAQDIEEK